MSEKLKLAKTIAPAIAKIYNETNIKYISLSPAYKKELLREIKRLAKPEDYQTYKIIIEVLSGK